MTNTNNGIGNRYKLPNGCEIVIRKMTIADLEEVHKLECQIYPDPWTFSHFCHEVMENKVSYTLVMELETKVIGFAVTWFIQDELHLANIAIDPQYRNLGLASLFMNVIFEEGLKRKLIRAFLEVREKNLAAINLYKKFGFEEIGVRRKYYRNGENALVMQRYLPHTHDSNFEVASF